MQFTLKAPYLPTGDQPDAIRQLVSGLKTGLTHQTLLGATGTGKTFSIANVISEIKKPTLILCHNKTLAAQLYGEFRQFFPENAIEYFVSYYDYYQPEAYIPSSDTYIEKDLSINEEIEKLRLSTTSALLSGRRDVLVVSSVSCIYGMGNPDDFYQQSIRISVGDTLSRNQFLHQLVDGLYHRTEAEFERGSFRVIGDTVDIFLAYSDHAVRVYFWGDLIEQIEIIDPHTGKLIDNANEFTINPANLFVTTKERIKLAIHTIQDDLVKQANFFNDQGKSLESKRIVQRVEYDLEMIRELGYCSGIENYSRYFDGRESGSRPFCLLDYFPNDWLLVIDESHVTIPQIRAMYNGDRHRKTNLVEYGFRLPSALDNRPLKFEEFESMVNQAIYVSATPGDYELALSEGVVSEQIIRPTGLLDPIIEIRSTKGQIDDLLEEIHRSVELDQRVLVTTLTKRMAEELNKYFSKLGIRCRYIHSEVETLERIEILRGLRLGLFDVLIGVNLLREGLDLPEVALVVILDADKEGFLRNHRSLIQTIGRAARNIDGKVIMYADRTTKSMQQAIDETNRRREKQIAYNLKHNQIPKALYTSKEDILNKSLVGTGLKNTKVNYKNDSNSDNQVVNDPIFQKNWNKDDLTKAISEIKLQMEAAAKALDFIEAARYRDILFSLQTQLETL
jgi:excinuclease ABC subunit B